jgi:UDP-3-O-[3-hydroxymyristoyl] N-acetylglucosamine deacetylase / 3-hydroxyacyl-[acyl-carrier-protein] dehydratase
MNDFQSTINQAVTVAGIGLHTGTEVSMTFKPASPGHGIVFKRIDMEGEALVPAIAEYVVDTSRGTTIEKNGARIGTVEHVMAALSGLQIDNVLIEIDNIETPIMDGSSKVFVEVLNSVGIKTQNAVRKYFTIQRNIEYYDKDKDVHMMALPENEFKVTVMIDYNSQVLGQQHAKMENIDDFREKFASSRTFCFLHELEMLLDNNLIRGGDLNNAIVVVDKKVGDDELKKLAKLFNKEQVEIREEGILNNIELHFPNEPARHKLLDVVGDLTLVGMPIKGKIIASKPGHSTNVEFAKLIRKEIKTKRNMGAPLYDPNQQPVYDINAIKDHLPHEYPFLLIDKIINLTSTKVVGIKNVTYNENFFQGHFPDEPVMPGVLIIEAMAQTGGILVMSQLEDPENYTTYFLKIDNARFKSKVVPGDTLIFDMELSGPIRRGICEMTAKAYVGDKLVAQAELVAQIVPKNKKK